MCFIDRKNYIYLGAIALFNLTFLSNSWADGYKGTVNDLSPKNLCQSPTIVKEIAKKFKYQAKHQLHSVSPTALTAISDIDFKHYESAEQRNGIRHWYCKGLAHLNDGTSHFIYYKIEKTQPFTALKTTNVEYCMESFQPWHIYDGFCRALRAHNLGDKFKITNQKA